MAVLGSGSGGNAIYAEWAEEAILIDAGLSLRAMERRLASIGGDLSRVRAVLVSHEHWDHVQGLPLLSKRYDFPIYMTEGTAQGLSPVLKNPPPRSNVRAVSPYRPFCVGPWTVRAFPTPHDAAESVGFVLEADGIRIGIATDMGVVKPEVVSELSGVNALVLESNHDPEMLRTGRYPLHVKQRIAGPYGHLANEEAGELLERIMHGGLRAVTLAHLSRNNNTPELAKGVAGHCLDGHEIAFDVASQMQPKALKLWKR